VDNRQALTKFLLAVEWTVESEVVQAAELLEQWRRRSPIEVSDALKLLGRNVAFQTDLVRGYAIDTLQEAPDAELSLYLLQLVQALKYEHLNDQNVVISGVSKKRNSRFSSLGDFLIERASKNIELANYLYWYLKVELDDEVFGRKYREVFSDMREKLLCIEHESSSSLQHRSMWDVLAAQDIFISNVMDCQRKSRDAKGKKDAKEQFLRDSLAKSLYNAMDQDWSVPLPSAPHIWVKGVKAESARMFKSALYPALIDFYVDEESSLEDQSKLANKTYKVIVKTGDDLRQDQLVITLIKLMDRILKRGTLDLCLKPYPIIAMSQTTGLVTFVEGSMPISQVLSSYNNSILSFFKSVAPSDEGKYNVDPNVMQTYIRSCAGYCVITYLIGVGDRHLDNIMLQPSGHCEYY
jgi:phosphatidylinositol 3-kinase